MPLQKLNKIDCVFYYQSRNAKGSTCQNKFNRRKRCILNTDQKRCDHKKPRTTNVTVFDDPKWCWKTSMNMLSQALSGMFYSEQEKFQGPKGEVHAEKRRKIGHYPFIMREIGHVVRMVSYIRKYFSEGYMTPRLYKPPKINGVSNHYGAPSFLDCGCGVGNVVMMAHFAGFDAYGIEYDPVTLQRGRRIFKQFRINPKRLFKGDILEYPNYADYDVLYSYCPMCNGKKEDEFENKLMLDMRIGALLCGISNGAGQGCKKIGKERVYFQRLDLGDHSWNLSSPYIKIAHEKD